MFVHRLDTAHGPLVGVALTTEEVKQIAAGEVVALTESVIPTIEVVLFASSPPDPFPEAAYCILFDAEDLEGLQRGDVSTDDLSTELDFEDLIDGSLFLTITSTDDTHEALERFQLTAETFLAAGSRLDDFNALLDLASAPEEDPGD